MNGMQRYWLVGLLMVLGPLTLAPGTAMALPQLWIVCPAGPPDCDFSSVNQAVNDVAVHAGDGISVGAGTYTEQVIVPERLTISGAGSGPRPVITFGGNSTQTLTIASGGAGTTLSHLDIRATGTTSDALEAHGAVTATDLALSATHRCAFLAGAAPSQLGPDVTASTTAGGSVCVNDRSSSTMTGLTVSANGPLEAGVFMEAGSTLTNSTVNADVALSMVGGAVRRTTLAGGAVGVIAGSPVAPSLVSDSVITSTAGGGAAAIANANENPGLSGGGLNLRNVTALASGIGSNGLEAVALVSPTGGSPGTIDARNVIARGAGKDVVGERAQSPCPSSFTCQGGGVTIGYSNFITTGGLLDASTFGHNQSTNPLLVNPVVGPGQDFHIACVGSPLIGAGTADASNGPSDRDGVAHPDPPSIGAYEYAGDQRCRPPGTSITRSKIKGKKRSAKFHFEGSGGNGALHFQCKLDHSSFARCTSPKRYRHLKPGRHVLRVRAVDATGQADPSPAKRKFHIPR